MAQYNSHPLIPDEIHKQFTPYQVGKWIKSTFGVLFSAQSSTYFTLFETLYAVEQQKFRTAREINLLRSKMLAYCYVHFSSQPANIGEIPKLRRRIERSSEVKISQVRYISYFLNNRYLLASVPLNQLGNTNYVKMELDSRKNILLYLTVLEVVLRSGIAEELYEFKM